MSENQPHADPAALGLAGFGMTTVLLNVVNAGIVPADSIGMVLPVGLFYGGMAQFCAGLWELKRGDTFGATAFCSFAAFWIAFAFMKYFEMNAFTPVVPVAGMVAFLILWGGFTAYMSISTFRLNRALQVIFVSLTILFILLAIGEGTGNEVVTKVAGGEGIFCGLSALYTSMAIVTNEIFGRPIFPLGTINRLVNKPIGDITTIENPESVEELKRAVGYKASE